MVGNIFDPGKKVNSSGFTLMEIIVTLIIITILSAVIISKAGFDDEYTLVSQVDLVKSHIRYAQTMAMNTDEVWGIDFSGTDTYSLFRNGATANQVRFPGQNNLTVDLPDGAAITTGIISFTKWGKPCTDAAGSTLQTALNTFTLSYGSAGSRNININKNTGYIP